MFVIIPNALGLLAGSVQMALFAKFGVQDPAQKEPGDDV